MSYIINFKISEHYLRADISGTADNTKLKQISADVKEMIYANQVNKIFIDVTELEGRMGIFDSLKHIEKFSANAKNIRVAVYDIKEHKYNNDFFENASLNRGFSICFFYDESEAKKWLGIEDITPEKVLVKEY